MTNKVYFGALKKLPSRFVHDDTRVGVFNFGDKESIIAANPNHAPIFFSPEENKWHELLEAKLDLETEGAGLEDILKAQKVLGRDFKHYCASNQN